MNDLISRQAAIDALERRLSEPQYQHNGEDWYCGMSCAESEIYELPSAQPERKKGKWEIYVISMIDGEGCKCSECGFEGVPYWDFCPNCGAKME